MRRKETSPLLVAEQREHHSERREPWFNIWRVLRGLPREYRILPISFLAACAVAITAASTITAYGKILCSDPSDCKQLEESRDASIVAISATIANGCALLVLGPYERLARLGPKVGLWVWLFLRGGSVVSLAAGVRQKSVKIALFARVLEGMASDNILHFLLNAIYARSLHQNHISRMMGSSLAVYLLGISLSPVAIGMFTSFMATFQVATYIFIVASIYLFVVHLPEMPSADHLHQHTDGDEGEEQNCDRLGCQQAFEPFSIILRPLLFYISNPRTLTHGIAMLCYNAATSYLFPMLMIYTSSHFSFTNQENGLIVSVITATSAAYLFGSLFVVPWVRSVVLLRGAKTSCRVSTAADEDGSHRRRFWHILTSDFFFAILSLTVLEIALFAFTGVSSPTGIYMVAMLASLGLATPSFIKAHLLHLDAGNTLAVAALSTAECTGSLLSPVILGSLQSTYSSSTAFFVGMCVLALSVISFSASLLVSWS